MFFFFFFDSKNLFQGSMYVKNVQTWKQLCTSRFTPMQNIWPNSCLHDLAMTGILAITHCWRRRDIQHEEAPCNSYVTLFQSTTRKALRVQISNKRLYRVTTTLSNYSSSLIICSRLPPTFNHLFLVLISTLSENYPQIHVVLFELFCTQRDRQTNSDENINSLMQITIEFNHPKVKKVFNLYSA